VGRVKVKVGRRSKRESQKLFDTNKDSLEFGANKLIKANESFR